MTQKRWFSLISFLFVFASVQANDERYIQIENVEAIPKHILASLSFDHGHHHQSKAYIQADKLKLLTTHGIRWVELAHPGHNDKAITRPGLKSIAGQWDAYPTYDQYLYMMNAFAKNHPDIAQLHEIGTSIQGRKILLLEITDNPNLDEAEPESLYTSTMHGDETVGFILLLRLIDTLLNDYGQDPRITHLINNSEIWINPLANPDGTYYGGNDTVVFAKRFLANGTDANRNFPDFLAGENPDGNDYAPETLAMIQLAQERNFVLAANFHGGAEVFNYPWDNQQTRHPDTDWYQMAGRQYADAAQDNWPLASSYFSGFSNGITNGYDWYSTNGNRQDYMNYYFGCREVTIELSDVKNPDASTLDHYWQANYEPLLAYLEWPLKAISGRIVNSKFQPIADALVEIEGRSAELAPSFTDPETGYFYRMLPPGQYNITASAPDYSARTAQSVELQADQSKSINFLLFQPTQLQFDSMEHAHIWELD